MHSETQCPYCLARFRVQTQYLHRSAKCKQCGRPFVMYSPSPLAEAERPLEYIPGVEAVQAALEARLGPTDGTVYTGMPPLYLGGSADVLTFPQYPLGGFAYVTCGLIPSGGQKTDERGPYELMMCSREANKRLASTVSSLGRYTLQELLGPGHTVDFGPVQPRGCTIRGVLCVAPDVPADPFRLFRQPCSVLLLVGVTQRELDAARDEARKPEVIDRLRAAGAIPYTWLDRKSVL